MDFRSNRSRAGQLILKPFAPVPARLITDAESSAHICVFMALAWKRERRTNISILGVAKIAEIARISKPTALSALAWLSRRGFIEIQACPDHRQRRAYRLPDLDENRSTSEPVNLETGKEENHNRSILEPEPVNLETGTGQSGNHVLDIEVRKKKKPSLRAEPAKRGTRLPSDFHPKEAHWELARSLGVDLNDQFERFRDYWIAASGRNAVKNDWDAALRNWIRKAADDIRMKGTTNGNNSPAGLNFAAVDAACGS